MSKNRGKQFASRADWLAVRSTETRPSRQPVRYLWTSTMPRHVKGTGRTFRRWAGDPS